MHDLLQIIKRLPESRVAIEEPDPVEQQEAVHRSAFGIDPLSVTLDDCQTIIRSASINDSRTIEDFGEGKLYFEPT